MSVTENPDTIHLRLSTFEDKGSITLIDPVNLISKPSQNRAFVILNQEIKLSVEKFQSIWKSSYLIICADGGSNRLREYVKKHDLRPDEYLPNFVIGDMDSISTETREYYEKQPRVTVKSQVSQYYSDLDKCISLINIYFNEGEKFEELLSSFDDHDGLSEYADKNGPRYIAEGAETISVVLLGGIGGRFDQTIHTLNKVAMNEGGKVPMKFMIFNTEFDEIIFMVQGRSFVQISSMVDSSSDNRKVGLLPLITESEITTRGLKWDVQNWQTSMKSSVSSSNYIVGLEGFYIEVTEPIFINLEI